MEMMFLGEAPEKREVSDSVFGQPYRDALVLQVLESYVINSHKKTKAQKTRSEVRGGGRKPWKQKGTGRARAGSIRSPLWRGGGVTFAAEPGRSHRKINKKMYRGAMASMLSEKLREDSLYGLAESFFRFELPKTSQLVNHMVKYEVIGGLVVLGQAMPIFQTAARNLENLSVCLVNELNPYMLIRAQHVYLDSSALDHIERWLA
jgi:large subunit ribosomal protein L4